MVRFALEMKWSGYAKEVESQFDSSAVINRSSIVTLFTRLDVKCSMLFTGDAYDRECDIRSTLAAWDYDTGDPVRKSNLKINVSVLKVS